MQEGESVSAIVEGGEEDEEMWAEIREEDDWIFEEEDEDEVVEKLTWEDWESGLLSDWAVKVHFEAMEEVEEDVW